MSGFKWLACIEIVIGYTKFNFEEVLRMPFVDFRSIIQYLNEKERRRFIEEKKNEAKLRASRKYK